MPDEPGPKATPRGGPAILMSVFGTRGDMRPMIELGAALRARGADVTMLVNPASAPAVRAAGLAAIGVGKPIDVNRLISEHPRYMSVRGGKLVLQEWFVPITRELYPAAIDAIDRCRPACVVSHAGSFGLAMAARRRGVPLAVTHMAPTSLLTPGILIDLPAWKRAAYRIVMPLMAGMVDRWLKPICRELSLPWRKGLFRECLVEADCVLGLWSPRFCPLQPTSPPNARYCGFPIAPTGDLPEAVESFLSDGDPPVVVSFGSSAVNIAGPLYRAAVGALSRIGRRGVLLVGGNDIQTGRADVIVAPGAPHGSLLPRCAAMVHHGGIGTTAAALQAGVPALIVPFGHDQFDNADRIGRLGAGTSLSRRHCRPRPLARALGRLLAGDAPDRTRQLATQLAGEPCGVASAADAVFGMLP